MSDVDVAPSRRHDHARATADAVPSSFTDSVHHSRTKALSREVIMKRGRSRDSRDGSRGRGRPEKTHRGSVTGAHARLPSSPLSPRPSQSHRGRERKYHEAEASHDDDEPRADERRRSRSSDRRDLYFDDTRRGKTPPARDAYPHPGKRHERSSSPRHHSRSIHYSEHHRDRSFSPSSRKRRRSRSPLPFPPSRSKRSKRERERDRRRRVEREERFEQDRLKRHGPSRPDRTHSPSRRRSISPCYDAAHRRYVERGDHPNDHPRRRGPSPTWEANPDDRLAKPARSRIDTKIRDLSRSPRPASRRSSFSRTHSPSRSIGPPQPRSSLDIGAPSRRSSPSFEPLRADYPPRSPKDHASRRSRKKAKYRDESRLAAGGPLASGANSIEVGTFRRTDRRNSFEASEPSRDGGQKYSDDFPPVQTSPQVNPDAPRYVSQTSPMHPEARSSKDVDPHYRPRRYDRQIEQNSMVWLTCNSQHLARDRTLPNSVGLAARQRRSQSPPRPPTGPLAQTHARGRGFSRGAFRGGMASSRGGLNGAVSSRYDQRSASTHSNKGAMSPPSHTMPDRSYTPNVQEEEEEEPENGLKPPQDDAAEETLKDETVAADQSSPPRPPPTAPTGPASSKFSFAFKTSAKNTVAAPKPEISQKFSAAPRQETQPIIDDRDRDLPKDTPREPASARARAEYHHSRAPPPEQPRTRKVIKTRRKLKPKPPLDPELAKSSSVYFRKPGNESVVGSGTYGKVFKGTHVYTKNLVALKRIRMEGERDGFPVTAMREVKLLQSLKHANIVELHEVMIEKNECYMVFEYLSHDLTGLLNHPTYKLDAAQKKHLAMQLFEGLDYLHKRGVLHRDIKAANILVSSDGILKLADFGLARFYAKRHQLDYTNRVITIWYRSPELLLGETRYGAAVDIWSAACVLVEIFTRHAIFPGDGGEISQLEKIYNILGTPNRKEWPGLADTPWFELLRPNYRKPNVFADKYRERVPAAAFDLLAEMFQYDPIKRPSAADVLEHPYFTIEQPPPRQAVEYVLPVPASELVMLTTL